MNQGLLQANHKARALQQLSSCCSASASEIMSDATTSQAMSNARPTVLIIDDDPALRGSLERLLRSVGLDSRLFASISEFLQYEPSDGPTCLVLDVRLPGRSGLDLQREFVATNKQIPIIFITGHGDIPMSVQAMKRGAIDFLIKPFCTSELLEAIHLGLARDRVQRESANSLRALTERFKSLSAREREIMIEVVRGRRSKDIAEGISISTCTVQTHRISMMRKMQAHSLPELERMARRLMLLPEKRNAS